MKYCFKHKREYNDICRFCEEEFIPAIQTNIDMPCIECGKPVKVEKDGYEAQGIFNVFCHDGECEDKYATKL